MSATEMDQFRRLVVFLEEVEAHADEQCDLALKAHVERAREHLLGLHDSG